MINVLYPHRDLTDFRETYLVCKNTRHSWKWNTSENSNLILYMYVLQSNSCTKWYPFIKCDFPLYNTQSNFCYISISLEPILSRHISFVRRKLTLQNEIGLTTDKFCVVRIDVHITHQKLTLPCKSGSSLYFIQWNFSSFSIEDEAHRARHVTLVSSNVPPENEILAGITGSGFLRIGAPIIRTLSDIRYKGNFPLWPSMINLLYLYKYWIVSSERCRISNLQCSSKNWTTSGNSQVMLL